MKKSIFLIIVLIISQSIFLYSQSDLIQGQQDVVYYPAEEYGYSEQNWCAIQDDTGKMIFGNTSGIVFFNGKDWKATPIDNGSAPRCFVKNNEGQIFVGASNEFGYIGVDSLGTLDYISLLDKLPEDKREFNDVWTAKYTNNKVYFFARKQLMVYENDTIKIFEEDFNPFFGYVVDDKIFVIIKEKGICYFNDEKFIPLPHQGELGGVAGMYFLLDYIDNKMLILSNNYGLYTYDLNLLDFSKNDFNESAISSNILQKFNSEAEDFLKNSFTYSMCQISDSLYVFGTFTGGVLVMDYNGEIVNKLNKKTGLPDNLILSIYYDNAKNLWLMLNVGLAYTSINSPLTVYNEDLGISGTVFGSVFYNDDLYVYGTKGIFYQPEQGESFIPINEQEKFTWYAEVVDNMLFANFSQFFSYVKQNQLVVTEKTSSYQFATCKAYPNTIFFQEPSAFYYSKYYINNQDVITDGKNIVEDVKGIVKYMKFDKDNNLWLSTEFNGIYYMKFNNTVENYEITPIDSLCGLPQMNGNKLHLVNNKILITNQHGIYEPEFVNNKINIKPSLELGDLSLRSVDNLLQINKNKFILEIDSGVCLLTLNESKQNFYFTPFKKIDRMVNDFKYYDNKIWISTADGLYKYDETVKKDYNVSYNSVINGVRLNSDSLIFNGNFYSPSSNFNKHFKIISSEQSEIQIPIIDFQNNNISFNYSTAFYEAPEKIEFKYKLEGFDNEWSSWIDKNEKEYTNLPPGEYIFKVKSKNIYDIESNEATYKFVILKPWYRTILAYIIYIILFVVIIYLIIKFYTYRLKQANIRLEQIVKERTHEISEKNEELEQQKEEIFAQAEELRTINEELQTTNEELEKLNIAVRETDNSIIIANKEGKVLWVNDAFFKIYQLNGEDLDDFNIIEKSTIENFKEILEEAIMNNKSVTYDSKVIYENKEELFLQTTLTPIIDTFGEIKQLVAVETDISEMTKAKEQIKEQNEHITASIRYAKTIQQAILPNKKIIESLYENFIIFRPKDIVSGDFYWFNVINTEDRTFHFVAAVDCTGHGVPGAFMSMIGSRILNEITGELDIYEPNEILTNLNKKIKIALRQEETQNDDGMDVCLCRLEQKMANLTEVVYSGAKRPLFYYNGEYGIKKLEADRKSIGGKDFARNKTVFSNQDILLNSGDVIYLSTDGYIDQNNPERKRFGTVQLIELLEDIKELSLFQQKDILEKELDAYMNGEAQRDDITLIGLKI